MIGDYRISLKFGKAYPVQAVGNALLLLVMLIVRAAHFVTGIHCHNRRLAIFAEARAVLLVIHCAAREDVA